VAWLPTLSALIYIPVGYSNIRYLLRTMMRARSALPARARLPAVATAPPPAAAHLSCPGGKAESRNPPGALWKKGEAQLRRMEQRAPASHSHPCAVRVGVKRDRTRG